MLELWPSAKLAIGPDIDTGFYYDIDFGETKISEADLKTIEKKMSHLAKQNLDFSHEEQELTLALAAAKERQEDYKVEIIEDLAKEGETKLSFIPLVSSLTSVVVRMSLILKRLSLALLNSTN